MLRILKLGQKQPISSSIFEVLALKGITLSTMARYPLFRPMSEISENEFNAANLTDAVLQLIPQARAIYVFGSWNTCFQRKDSDIDLAVLMST